MSRDFETRTYGEFKQIGRESRWTHPAAEALRQEFYKGGDNDRIRGLVRNGLKPKLKDPTAKKPLPADGCVRVLVDNSGVHWACNQDTRLNVEERLNYPHFNHYEVTLDVIDYSGTEEVVGKTHEHICTLLDDLRSSGYHSPTAEEAANFALQYEVPLAKHLYVGTSYIWVPRYANRSSDNLEADGAPMMLVLRSGGCMEVWHIDQHESFRDLRNSGFLVKRPNK
jgi:hypothetical protein